MACYHPLEGYRSETVNPSGKRSIIFDVKERWKGNRPILLACGQCLGCRMDRSRDWAVRCLHESTLHEANCFITLTYDPVNLPPDGSLVVRDFQLFMKRLRKRFAPRKIRFFHCGEYGEEGGRPHYHALLFNWDFPDRRYLKTENGNKLYTSAILEELWDKGQSSVGDVTFESAAYVARYIVKKRTGPDAWMYYEEIDFDTGEVLRELKPEYVTMSRRPGIAHNWFEKFKSDVFPDDFVVINGKKVHTPQFYKRKLEQMFPEDYEVLQNQRANGMTRHRWNYTRERLDVREEIHYAKVSRLTRSYEK